MTEFTLINHRSDKTKTFDSRSEAESKRDDMISLGVAPEDLEIKTPETDGGPEVIDPEDGTPRKTSATHPEEFSDELPDDGPNVKLCEDCAQEQEVPGL